eukprot:824406_1
MLFNWIFFMLSFIPTCCIDKPSQPSRYLLSSGQSQNFKQFQSRNSCFFVQFRSPCCSWKRLFQSYPPKSIKCALNDEKYDLVYTRRNEVQKRATFKQKIDRSGYIDVT